MRNSILQYKDSEILVPIICFYMEEHNITDLKIALIDLRLDLDNFSQHITRCNYE